MAAFTAATLAYFALAATVAGTAVSVYGQNEARKAQSAATDYNAKLAENQALQQDMEAREDIRRERERNRTLQASNRVAIAMSGVTESGSPLEDMAYNAGQLELQTLDKSRQAGTQFQLGMSQAQQLRLAGAAESKAAGIGMAGTILSGLGSAAGQYGNFKYIGAVKR